MRRPRALPKWPAPLMPHPPLQSPHHVRDRATSAAVVGVVLLALLGGCGGGMGARPWAASVCEAPAPWLVSGAESASETARAKVAGAGAPDVPGGGEVARGYVDSLTAVRDAYRRARQSLQGLDTAEAKTFYDGVSTVLETLNTEYARSALDTSWMDSPELKEAFDEVPECR